MLAEQLNSLENQTPLYQLTDLDNYFEGQIVHSFYLEEANRILLQNQERAFNADPNIANNTPLPINVLSVSDRIVKQEEFEDTFYLREALFLDSLRTVAEVRNKYSPIYFPTIFQSFDEESEDLIIGPRSLSEISENGLSPFCEPEEVEIRALDYVDNKLNIELVKKCRENNSTVTLLRIKECPDYIVDKYQRTQDEKDLYNGYVPQIKKFVIQRDRITPEGVYSDHFALPGTLIDAEVVRDALGFLSGEDKYQDLSGLELRAKSFIMPNEPESLFEFVELLDDLATQKHHQRVFTGEVAADDTDLDYSQTINQFLDQDQQYRVLADEISEFLLNESRQNNDPRISEMNLIKLLTERSFQAFKHNPREIKRIFGLQTAIDLEVINFQYQITKDKTSYDNSIESLIKTLPLTTFCGAGSCGLVGVITGSEKDKELSRLGLKGEKLMDTIRKCPYCGKKSVHYDMHANKACTNCKKTDIKTKKPQKPEINTSPITKPKNMVNKTPTKDIKKPKKISLNTAMVL